MAYVVGNLGFADVVSKFISYYAKFSGVITGGVLISFACCLSYNCGFRCVY